MSFQFFWNEEDRAKIENMRSEFLVWNENANKKMEKHMRKIEKFFSTMPRSAASSKPIIAHNAYPTGCHHHKKEEEKSWWSNKDPSKSMFNQTIVDQTQIRPPQWQIQTSPEPATLTTLQGSTLQQSP